MTLNVVRTMLIDNVFFDVNLWHFQHCFINENIFSKDVDDSTNDESINFNFDNYFFSNFVDFDIFHSIANRARSNEMKIHRSYWILFTSKVNRFLLVMINNYIFLIVFFFFFLSFSFRYLFLIAIFFFSLLFSFRYLFLFAIFFFSLSFSFFNKSRRVKIELIKSFELDRFSFDLVIFRIFLFKYLIDFD